MPDQDPPALNVTQCPAIYKNGEGSRWNGLVWETGERKIKSSVLDIILISLLVIQEEMSSRELGIWN